MKPITDAERAVWNAMPAGEWLAYPFVNAMGLVSPNQMELKGMLQSRPMEKYPDIREYQKKETVYVKPKRIYRRSPASREKGGEG